MWNLRKLFPKPIAIWEEPAELIAQQDRAERAEWPFRRQALWMFIGGLGLMPAWMIAQFNPKHVLVPWYAVYGIGMLAGWFIIRFELWFLPLFKTRAKLFDASLARLRGNKVQYIQFKNVTGYTIANLSDAYVIALCQPNRKDFLVGAPCAQTRDLLIATLSSCGVTKLPS